MPVAMEMGKTKINRGDPTFVGDLSDSSSLRGKLLVKVEEVERGQRRFVERGGEEGWLQWRQGCLKCRLN